MHLCVLYIRLALSLAWCIISRFCYQVIVLLLYIRLFQMKDMTVDQLIKEAAKMLVMYLFN